MSSVYFIREVGGDGPVKIGCSRLPESRLKALMTWAPRPLEVAAVYPGNQKVERQFHSLFRSLHSHGEWFHRSQWIDACIAAINAGCFDPACLPTARQLPRLNCKPPTAIARVARSYRSKLSFKTYRIGLWAPDSVRAAEKVLDSPDDSIRRAAIQRVEQYLANYVSEGRPMPYEWAVAALAKHCERTRQALPIVREAA